MCLLCDSANIILEMTIATVGWMAVMIVIVTVAVLGGASILS